MKNKTVTQVGIGVVLVATTALVFLGGYLYGQSRHSASLQAETPKQNVAGMDEHQAITPLSTSPTDTVTRELQFILEEEKLAHDIYTKLYEKWGTRQFGNILRSEVTHQEMVLAVMQSRGVNDVRKDTIGQFSNSELQALYDSLLAQGMQSVGEAIKVGIAVEQRDIADLDKAIAATAAEHTDIIATYQQLRAASERHLAAFQRAQ